ncbi:RNA dependent RNA polymerase domain-containing protein [Ditylenchus destructor]|uniref:RNA-dependent RNA polymerase n=1 Tax=Ditylenchus destructor TaxID=166010 RepID=A0AAD4N2E7_9BILA|nr:RNA dependent RNA polymerase domain-containing protein [Ditylenchus destructor]
MFTLEALFCRGGVILIFDLLELFKKLYDQRITNAAKHNDMNRHGYIKIRKVMITPSRMILFPPEMLMSNRVFRYNPTKYPPDSFLRVIFRDEDWSRVHKKNVTFKLINQFIGERLKTGFEIAGRVFNHVGASNSQLRDAGCVFMNESIQEINKFRQQFGSFSTTSIPKMMARLGQCFTQALESGVDMSSYKMTIDYTGGADRYGSPYVFSDGCGSVSKEAARHMAGDLQLQNIPSCFQFRFAGFKGVVQVDHRLRECNFLFRPSQLKFEAREDAEHKMELVKYSSPVTLSLNKPLINILDQVSALQNHESHVRICDRIKDLLEIHMNNLCDMLTNEERAREKLNEFTRLIHYDKLDFFNVTEEPFFRQLLMSAAKVSIYKLRKKHHISIPADLGRVMFGVVDDTGFLQYGQVFVQYTKNASLHNPADGAHKIVRTGPIMVTKNPCIVGGDVRIFEAVDIPALRHHNDVIVFPQSGPRPHPDEMAGSDLDGDEYGVIWDEQLMISANETAFDYTGEKIEVKSTAADAYTEIQDKIADYMVQSMQNEHVGQIANSHLAVSDLYGIQADVCYGIAKKHSQAVDFQKTGHQPNPLLIYWDDEKDRPPERYERAPDYMEREHEVTNRLNGKLFREIRDMSEFITSAIEDNEAIEAPPFDLSMIHDGLRDEETRDKYMTEAAEHYATYGLAIQRLMENHGLNEGELFSGTFSTLRNKLSDRENDDMSFFNTTRVIKEQLQIIVATARMKFFGGEEGVIEFTNDPPFYNPYMDSTDILSRVCDRVCFDDIPEELKIRASAYYLLSYDTDRKLLSFPWIVWDVLKLVNRELRIAYDDIPLLHNRSDPLGASVSQHITEYIEKREDQFQMFLMTYAGKGTVIWKYVEQHSGLAELMYFCVEWGNKFGAFSNNCFEKKHLCLLLILHGLNHFTHNPQQCVSTAYWLNRIDEKNTSSVNNTEQPMQHPTELQDRIGGVGRIFISFLQFLASNEFKKVDTLDFSVCGLDEDSFFCKGEWAPLHNAAERTYHHLVFTARKDILPSADLESTESNSGLPSSETKVSEQIPFIIEMPHQNRDLFIDNESLMASLCTLTGCIFIKMRLHPDFKHWGSGPPPTWKPRKEGDECLQQLEGSSRRPPEREPARKPEEASRDASQPSGPPDSAPYRIHGTIKRGMRKPIMKPQAFRRSKSLTDLGTNSQQPRSNLAEKKANNNANETEPKQKRQIYKIVPSTIRVQLEHSTHYSRGIYTGSQHNAVTKAINQKILAAKEKLRDVIGDTTANVNHHPAITDFLATVGFAMGMKPATCKKNIGIDGKEQKPKKKRKIFSVIQICGFLVITYKLLLCYNVTSYKAKFKILGAQFP